MQVRISLALRTALAAAAFASFSAQAAQTAQYAFTQLQGAPNAINDAGQIVGSAVFNGLTSAATFDGNGQAQQLPGVATGYNSYATGINNTGQIVGFNYQGGAYGVDDAFIYSNGQFTSLGSADPTAINDAQQIIMTPPNGRYGYSSVCNVGGSCQSIVGFPLGNPPPAGTQQVVNPSSTYARTINQNGLVVGQATRADGSTTAISWSDGATTDLGTQLGLEQSQANGVNDNGQIVIGSTSGGLLYQNGQTIALDSLAGYSTTNPVAINNGGQIVGTAANFSLGAPDSHAVTFIGGTLFDLNSLVDLAGTGWTLTEAYGINASGQIIGTAYNATSGVSTGFLLNPVPEPQTYVLTFIGLAAAVSVARRRA